MTPAARDSDHYFQLPELARYAGLSITTLTRYLKDPQHPIPHAKIGGRYLVKRSEFDAWVAASKVAPRPAPAKVRELYQRSKAGKADAADRARVDAAAADLVARIRGGGGIPSYL